MFFQPKTKIFIAYIIQFIFNFGMDTKVLAV